MVFLAKNFGFKGSDFACHLFHANAIGTFTSLFVDIHIALASVLTILRCRTASALLVRTLVAVWPIGIAFGLLDIYLTGYTPWRSKKFYCDNTSNAGYALRDVCTLTSVAICAVVYVACNVKLSIASGAAQDRALRRALFFVLANVISVGPVCVLDLFAQFPYDSWLYHPFWTLFLLGGFLNTCVYVAADQHTRYMMRQERLVGDPMHSTQITASLAFAVAFGEAEEVPVSFSEADARGIAENGIVALESARRFTNGDEGDCPGMYEALCQNVGITSGIALNSDRVGVLDEGAHFLVLDVVLWPEIQRVRARIKEPPGWLSLIKTDTGQRLAHKIDLPGSLSSADEFQEVYSFEQADPLPSPTATRLHAKLLNG